MENYTKRGDGKMIEHPMITQINRTGYPKGMEEKQLEINHNRQIKQLFHVYECQDCVVTFAVEQVCDDQSDVCCPICSSDNVRDVDSGEMIIGR